MISRWPGGDGRRVVDGVLNGLEVAFTVLRDDHFDVAAGGRAQVGLEVRLEARQLAGRIDASFPRGVWRIRRRSQFNGGDLAGGGQAAEGFGAAVADHHHRDGSGGAGGGGALREGIGFAGGDRQQGQRGFIGEGARPGILSAIVAERDL